MKIALINGSHRQGNTQLMLQIMQQEIQSLNPNCITTIINLRQKNIQFSNQKDEKCSITQQCPNCCRDDMKEIYQLIESADMIILASPIYFSNVSARMKNFIDRCCPYFNSKKLRDKTLVMVGVGGSPDPKSFFDNLIYFGTSMKMKIGEKFYAKAVHSDSVKKSQSVINELRLFTKHIILGSSQIKEIQKPKF